MNGDREDERSERRPPDGDPTRRKSGSDVDFDALRERASAFGDCGSPRAVREELASAIRDELGFDRVGVFQTDGERFHAPVCTQGFDETDCPRSLPVGEPPLSSTMSSGETRYGPTPEGLDGEAGYYATPLSDDGCVLVLEGAERTDDAVVAAGLSLLAGGAESALSALEGGHLRRNSTRTDAGEVSDDDLLDALSHAFPDYAFVYDRGGTYLDVTLGGRRISLYSREELVGQNVRDVLATDAADRVLAAIRAAIETRETQKLEYSVEAATDERRYEARVAPLPRDSHDRDATVLVARDVTERHARERDLRRQNERLDAFASIVSHDLRNPLATASGFLHLVREDVDDERLDRVADAHDRMESLVEDLLALARDGHAAESPQRVSLADAVRRAWTTVGSDGEVTTETDLAIHADPGLLRQLLENLFRNADEHTGDQPAVTVGALADGSGFYVADDGPGIPPGEREAVFDSGYTSTREGIGLGLAIVEQIAEAHGWTASVTESGAGGARFEVHGVRLDPGGE